MVQNPWVHRRVEHKQDEKMRSRKHSSMRDTGGKATNSTYTQLADSVDTDGDPGEETWGNAPTEYEVGLNSVLSTGSIAGLNRS
jgi:hypothetical protein